MKVFFRWLMERIQRPHAARLQPRLHRYQGKGDLARVPFLESRDPSQSRRSQRFSFGRAVEQLEARITPSSGNIAITNVSLVDGNSNPLSSVSAGESVYVQANFTTTNLPANASYDVSFNVNGFTLNTGQLTYGAGVTGTSNWYASWGTFIITPGANQITATVDPDQSVAETSYADNSMSISMDGGVSTGETLSYSVSQIRSAYGLNSLSDFGSATPDGTGQTIAIVDAYNDPDIYSDLDQFDQRMNLASNSSPTLYQSYGTASTDLTVYNQSGVNISSQIANSGQGLVPSVDPTGGWELEETLDVEWVHAIAPGAHIDLIEANDNYSGLDLSAATAASLPGVSVVSMSWGGGEYPGETSADSNTFVTPTGHSGVTFLASAGDDGTPGGYPSFSPNVIAVGGTDLTTNGDSYGSETAWSFPTPDTLDNGSSSYSQTGSWANQIGGFSGNYSTSSASSSNSATWTTTIDASEMGSGGGTEVSATWVAAAGNATNATYSIYDGDASTGTLLDTVTVNQTITPTGTSDGNTHFQELGVYYPASDQITVVLNAGSANGTVSADAIGIAPGWATAGGESLYETEPSYQSTVQSTGFRTTPDVSFDGSDSSGVTTWQGGIGFDYFGTSLSCPCWAGIIAIVDQGRVAAGGSPLNSATDQTQALQAIYSMPSSDFHDITTGYNGLFASPGYDELTGRGSPITNLLIPDMMAYELGVSPTITAPTTASIFENTTLAFIGIGTISVTDPSGTAEQLTLSVSNGTLSLETSTGVTVTGEGTASMTITGSLANLNSDLATLSYTPTPGYHGTDTLSLSDEDTTYSLTGTASVAITVNPPAVTSLQLTAPNVAYSGQAYSATATVTANGNTVTSPAVTYTYYYATDTTFADPISAPTQIGNYVVVANYAGSPSDIPSQAQASFSITQANITLTIGNDQQTYGSAANLAVDLPATIGTGVNGERLGIIYSSTGDTNTAHVNTYAITGVLSNGTGLLSDYNITLINGTLTVDQDSITLTIANDAQYAGTAANLGNDLGTTISTGVNGQNLDIVYSSTGDTKTAAIGQYAITGVLSNGTGLLSDYNVTLNSGTLSVNKLNVPPLPGGAIVANSLIGSDSVVYDLDSSGNVYGWPGTGTTWTIMDSGVNDIAIAGNGDLVDLHIGGPGGGGLYEFTSLSASSYVALDSGVASFAIAGNGDVVDLRVTGSVYAFTSPSPSSGMSIDSGVTKLAIAGNGDVVDLHANGGLYEFTSLSASSSVPLDSGVASFAIAGNGDVVDLHEDGGLYGFTAVSASSYMAFDAGVTSFAIAGNGDVVDLHYGRGGGGGALNEFTSFGASSEVNLDGGVISFAIAGNGDVVELHGDGGLYGFTSVSASSYVAIDSGVVRFAIAGNGNIVDLHATGGGTGGQLLEFTSFSSSSDSILDTGVASFAVLGNGDVVDLHEDGGLYEFTSSSASSYIALDAGVSKLLIAGNGAMVDLHWNGGLYEFTTYRNAAGFVVLDTAVAGFAVAGNGDVVDLHGDGGLYEFTSPSASSYIAIDSFVTNFEIAGNGDVVDLHAASGGLYEFTTYRSTTGDVVLDTGVASFAIAGNGDVVDLRDGGGLYEFTLPTASSAVQIDSSVTSLAIAGNGDVVDLHGNGGLSEFTTYRSASKFVAIDSGVVSFAIAGNGDVVDLHSDGSLYEYPLPNASSAVSIDTGVASFLIAGDGDVVDRHWDGGMREFTTYRNAANYVVIDTGVTSFAIAGNGDVVDLRSSGGLYEYTGPIANIFQPIDSGVTSFAIAGNGNIVDLHFGSGSSGGGLYAFSAYRNPASYAPIDSGVTSFAVAGDGDVVALHASGGLFEFTSPVALSDMALDNGVTSFGIAGNGDVVVLHGDGGLYEFTAYRNPASYMAISDGVATFVIAGSGDIVYLQNDGELFEDNMSGNVVLINPSVTSFGIAGGGDLVYLQSNGDLFLYSTSSPDVLIDVSVSSFQSTSNGLVEDQHSSGNEYIQTMFGGPVSQPISEFI